MRGRKPSQEQARQLLLTSSALAAISKHPSWPDLVDEINAKQERIRAHVLTTTMSPAPVTQRVVDYWRGFNDGMQYLLKIPTGAEHRLEDYLKRNSVELEGAAR
jgi:hypothetical protein